MFEVNCLEYLLIFFKVWKNVENVKGGKKMILFLKTTTAAWSCLCVVVTRLVAQQQHKVWGVGPIW